MVVGGGDVILHGGAPLKHTAPVASTPATTSRLHKQDNWKTLMHAGNWRERGRNGMPPSPKHRHVARTHTLHLRVFPLPLF